MSRSTEELIFIWEQAVRDDVGVRIQTDDRKLLQQQLYRARTMEGNGKYDDLTIVLPDEEGTIFIVHKGIDNG